jgi:hypothetical protein
LHLPVRGTGWQTDLARKVFSSGALSSGQVCSKASMAVPMIVLAVIVSLPRPRWSRRIRIAAASS